VLPGFTGVAVGLVLVGVGSGGLKANATSLVGSLYAEGDERRDAGFSLFYLGINLGALAGPLLTGLAQKELGFHYGFGLAAIGMAAGLVQYTIGRKNLPDSANELHNPLPASKRTVAVGVGLVGAAVIAFLVTFGLITAENLADVAVGAIVVAAVAYFVVILSSKKITAVERKRVVAFVPLFLTSAVFWSLFQQQFTVVAQYSDKRLDRDILGWEMPVSWVQSINPIMIIALAGVFAAAWTKMGSRQPSSPIKFALGTMTMGVAFWLFIPMAGGGTNSAPLLGLIGILLVFTVAELMLSPVGLSLSTKLAPEIFKTQMVALFFLSVALGSAMSGYLAQFYSVETERLYFGVVGGVAVALGALLALFSRPIRSLMSGVH
jgi:POT family proton-dependent oligopeptide transporter